MMPEKITKTLDLGCGLQPKNPFNADQVFGIDIRESKNIKVADLSIEPIPFDSETFDFVTAFDFIEHVPRVIYMPNRKFCFVDLMSEIFRVLKPGGRFLSFTPAYPHGIAWRDPTHVNIITIETFPLYFDTVNCLAKMYGFKGGFEIEKNEFHSNKAHIVSILKKP